MSQRELPPFESRAAGADAEVWAALMKHAQNLPQASDVEAVLVGAVTAVTRLAYHTQASPSEKDASAIIRGLGRQAAKAVHQQAITTAATTDGSAPPQSP